MERTTLILATDEDPVWRWAEPHVRRRLGDVRVCDARQLVRNRLLHRVSDRRAEWVVEAPDFVLRSSDVQAVLTFQRAVPAASVDHVAGPERRYAYEEMAAALCSMLLAVQGPVINPSVPLSLSGVTRSRAQWRHMARAVGLPLAGQEKSEAGEQWVHVLEQRIISPVPVPGQLGSALVRLRNKTDCPLLGARFRRDGDEWRFISATEAPDLRNGGTALITAICDVLEGRS